MDDARTPIVLTALVVALTAWLSNPAVAAVFAQ